jgi:hypothetical protein
MKILGTKATWHLEFGQAWFREHSTGKYRRQWRGHMERMKDNNREEEKLGELKQGGQLRTEIQNTQALAV